MVDPNPSQQRIIDSQDGMIVVDAGPGTGKTQTIVQRYVGLVSRDDVTPSDVLMLTFTRNAAAEMEERIKRSMSENGLKEKAKLVQVKTFDSFCLSIVMDSPEDAGSLFGIDAKLTHTAMLVENRTLINAFFNRFMDRFLEDRAADYGDWAIIGDQNRSDLFELLNRLMARGIYPIKGKGWFGGNNGQELLGDPVKVLENLLENNVLTGKRGGSASNVAKAAKGMERSTHGELPWVSTADMLQVEEELLQQAAEDDRGELIRFIHDVYWHYVRHCIEDDHLTFGINAMLAFSILYGDDNVRRLNSYRYLVIDEFQDTNASQLMMSLMVMKEPNLCAVGDWKQGIYGFRFVSIDNIIDFENRVIDLRRQLNEDHVRVPFSIPEVQTLKLDVNYRSSQLIVDKAFECLTLSATDNDSVNLKQEPVLLDAHRDAELDSHTDIRYVMCDNKEDEAMMVARVVRDYVYSGNYTIHTKEGTRSPNFGDIAVLCRTTSTCRAVNEALESEGISSFLQGDVEIMSTREGKLALAWLRFVNNDSDPWGYVPIMVDMGYSLVDCLQIDGRKDRIPTELIQQRNVLYRKRRRVTDLLTTLFSWYGMDNDITQTIISTLSSAHRGSLLTISDLITIIEDGIDAGSKGTYPVEADIQADSVTVMTMHKSKGLEFPIVIIPYLDTRIMPSTSGDTSVFTFDEVNGIRCGKVVDRIDGYAGMYRSWKTEFIKAATIKDYDEERRLMFVAMSRAKQYETLICSDPSKFIKGLCEDGYVGVEDCPDRSMERQSDLLQRPDTSGYTKRKQTVGVHSVMGLELEDGLGGMTDVDEESGKGKEYGIQVHDEAQRLHYGVPPSGKYPESEYILGQVLSRRELPGFIKSYSEIDCTLPLDDLDIVLKGVIDLLLVFEDRIEVHDYKTDISKRLENAYELQLNVYAEAAARFYNLPVKAFIQYVSQREVKEVELIGMDRIVSQVRRNLPSSIENEE